MIAPSPTADAEPDPNASAAHASSALPPSRGVGVAAPCKDGGRESAQEGDVGVTGSWRCAGRDIVQRPGGFAASVPLDRVAARVVV